MALPPLHQILALGFIILHSGTLLSTTHAARASKSKPQAPAHAPPPIDGRDITLAFYFVRDPKDPPDAHEHVSMSDARGHAAETPREPALSNARGVCEAGAAQVDAQLLRVLPRRCRCFVDH